MIIQAGQSGRGRRFARALGGADLRRLSTTPACGRARLCRVQGRTWRMRPRSGPGEHSRLIYPVVAATRAEAEDKMAVIDGCRSRSMRLSLLSEALNFDFARKGMDEPFSDEEIAAMSGVQGMRDRVLQAQRQAQSDSARLHRDQRPRDGPRSPIVGGPQGGRRPDGGLVRRAARATASCSRPPHVPGAYEDFVRFVVPELQQRGLFRRAFAGLTLRENLGLPVPALGAWRGAKTPPTTAKQT